MNLKNNWWSRLLKDVMKSKQLFITGSSSFFILLIFGFISIFSDFRSHEVSTFTQWYKRSEEVLNTKSPSRSLASETPQFACLSDGIRIENLKKDVQYLESQMDSGTGIKGAWRGLDLETIPTPQAQFLLDFDKLIGKVGDKRSFPECIDLPCVINTIYDDPTGLSGYISYYWYLKTGTMISLSDKVPGKKPSDINTDEYFFTKDQLISFWKLAKSLPETFLHIPGLKSIHKIPDNHQVEGFLAQDCSISLNSGILLFKEGCLKDEDNKFFYNVASAMAKQIDLSGDSYTSISKSKDWYELSKWNMEEYWFEQYATYAESWFSEASSNYFISKSAATHPTRQFAETLAFFRYYPEKVSMLHSEIQNFVSNNFFNHYKYDKEGLLRKYLRVSNQMWDKVENNFWISCLDQHFTVEHIDKVGTSKKSFETMNTKLFACMDSKIPGFVSEVLTHVKKDQYEGCDFLNLEKYQDQADRFIELLSKNIHKKIYKVHFDLEKWGIQLLIGLKVKQEMGKMIDPTAIYVSCYFSSDKEQCFNNKLKHSTHKLVKPHKQMHADYIHQLVAEIQNQFKFVEVKEKSESIAKKYLFPYYANLRKQSEKVWTSCQERKLKKTEKFNFPMVFKGGANYVHPTMLNCINKHIDSIAHHVLSEPLVIQSKDLSYEFELNKTEHKFAEYFLTKRVHQYFKEFISDEYELEQEKMATYFVENSQKLVDYILSDKNFLSEVYSKAQIENRCIGQLKVQYPTKYYFHTESDITNHYGKPICDQILSKDQVKRSVANSIQEEWTKVRDNSIKFYKQTYQSIIDHCYDKFPNQLSINYVKNSKLRKDCMEEGHDEAVFKVIEKFSDLDNSKYFKKYEHELKKELHILKEEIINDMRKTDRVISSEK